MRGKFIFLLDLSSLDTVSGIRITSKDPVQNILFPSSVLTSAPANLQAPLLAAVATALESQLLNGVSFAYVGNALAFSGSYTGVEPPFTAVFTGIKNSVAVTAGGASVGPHPLGVELSRMETSEPGSAYATIADLIDQGFLGDIGVDGPLPVETDLPPPPAQQQVMFAEPLAAAVAGAGIGALLFR